MRDKPVSHFIKITLGQGVTSFVVALSVKVRPNKFLVFMNP